MSRSKKAKDHEVDAALEHESVADQIEIGAEPTIDNALVLVEKLQEFGINARTIIVLTSRSIWNRIL